MTNNAAALLDHPLIADRYFAPFRVSPPNPTMVDVPGARLACVHYAPHGLNAPTIVHFHGNGEVVADYVPELVEILAAFGWNTFLAEYRGYGGSTGEPLLGKLLDDVPKLLAAARCPAERMVVFGRSVGSLFAVEAVRCAPHIAGLVIESGIADPLERFLLRMKPKELGATREDLAAAVNARLNQRKKLQGYPGPVLVLHARNDDLVPVSHGQRLNDWAAGPVAMEVMPRGDHNTILALNAERYFRALADFLERVRAQQR